MARHHFARYDEHLAEYIGIEYARQQSIHARSGQMASQPGHHYATITDIHRRVHYRLDELMPYHIMFFTP